MSTGELTERTHRQEPLINSRTDASLDLIGLAPTTRTSITVTWPSQNTNSPTRPSRGQRHQTCAPPANLQLVINGERNLEKTNHNDATKKSVSTFAFWQSCRNWCVDATSPNHTIKVVIMQPRHRSIRPSPQTWDPKKKKRCKKRHTTITL